MKGTDIRQALQPLIGLPFRCLGRAANMLWIQFGELVEAPGHGGGVRRVGQWAVHVQCAWRLTRLESILVAYRDFYYDPQGEPLDDWDTPGKSQFDHITNTLNEEFKAFPPCVLSVVGDNVGGFAMQLSRDCRLDVFPDQSKQQDNSEHWRIFQPGAGTKHFIAA